MKKKIFIVILFAMILLLPACKIKKESGSKELTDDASVEDLIDIYIDGMKNKDPDRMWSPYVFYIRDYYKDKMTKEKLEQMIDETFGDNYEATYNITSKEKAKEIAINSINDYIKENYPNESIASECYMIEGTMTQKGSKKTFTSDIKLMYCNFGGKWRLVGDAD